MSHFFVKLNDKARSDLRWLDGYYQRRHGLAPGDIAIVQRALETLRTELERINQATGAKP